MQTGKTNIKEWCSKRDYEVGAMYLDKQISAKTATMFFDALSRMRRENGLITYKE